MRNGLYQVWIGVTISILVIALSMNGAFGIRFVIEKEECFSHKVEMGETVHYSFVVIKSEGDWHYGEDGVDLVVPISIPYSFFFTQLSLSIQFEPTKKWG